jgi:hypothetical protein
MKRILTLLLVIVFTSSASAKDTTKVLLIGNSLSFWNNMPKMIEEICNAGGKNVMVQNMALGGHSLEMHTHSTVTLNFIDNNEWDYVVLQGGRPFIALEDSLHLVLPFAKELSDRVHSKYPETKIIFAVDHSYITDIILYDEIVSWSYFQDMITIGTKRLADSLDYMIVPCGVAFNDVRLQYPDEEYFDKDSVHPSPLGSYIMACTYYSVLFKESSVGLDYHIDLDPIFAEKIQEIASNLVLDDLDYWNYDLGTDVKEIYYQSNLSIYPNPCHDVITIQSDDQMQKVTIFDLSGKKIAERNPKQKEIHLKSIPNGFYIVAIETNKGIRNRILIVN